VGLDVVGADDLMPAVDRAVERAPEQQTGDVGPGDQDIGGGGELGEQPIGELRLARPVLTLRPEVAGLGQGVAEGQATLWCDR
jgi:hypothetical protein